MRDLKWLGKCALFGRRKEDADDDAPIATRLRSSDKAVEPSQTDQRNGLTASNNQTDNQTQHLTHQSSGSKVTNSRTEVHSSSSSRTRHNRSSVFPHETHGSRQSTETKSPSKSCYEHREKQITASKRSAHQPRSEEVSNNASSSSSHQVGREKMRSVRLSGESSKHRPLLEDPDDLPVVELHTRHIRSEDNQRRLMGWTCEFCEKDVGVSPFEEEEGEDSCMYPEVSVFPCGHVFHSSCLQRCQFGDQDLSDGPCIFCLSLFP